MGVVAILSDAVIWAATGTFLTAKLAKIDFLTIVTFRSIFAVAFIVAATFALGSQDDLWHMDPNTVWQLALAGLVAYVIAEPAYTLTLAFLGLTRGYTAVIGLNSVASFVLPAIFLGEAIGWREAAGGAVILSGVYLVAFYGRAAARSEQAAAPLHCPKRPGAVSGEPLPLAVSSDTTARTGPPTALGVRIPGIGITLPRRAVGLAIIAAVILSCGYRIAFRDRAPTRNGRAAPPPLLAASPDIAAQARRPVTPGVRIPGIGIALPRRALGLAVAVLILSSVYRLAVYGRTGARTVQAASPARRLKWSSAASEKPSSQAVHSDVAAQAGGLVAPGVRIPGIGITLPRLTVGLAIAFIAALGWAGDATILRAVAPGIDAAPVALAQLWPAMIVFIVWFTIARRGRPLTGMPPKGTTSLIGGTGALTTGLGTMLVIIAVTDIGAGPTAVLFAMSTIFALPLGMIFLKERVTIWGLLGVCVAVAGVAIIAI